MPRMSVVIPAHDEERTIGRLLMRLVDDDPAEELDIIVVPNGCSDRTADVARSVSPRIRVIEIEAASKVAALNAGDAATDLFPRAYVDADVQVTGRALLDLLGPLSEPGADLTAAPLLRVDTNGASLLSRLYHQIWVRTPYVANGPIGCGVYVLSRTARERFGIFPQVIADDLYIDRLAGAGARLIDRRHTFVFHAPRTTDALLARLTRATLGNIQLERDYGLAAATNTGGGLLRLVAPRPWLWPGFAVYAALRLLAGRRAQKRLAAGELRWSRDESTRQ